MFVLQSFKVMQKETIKAMGGKKKYGMPYERKHLLKKGDYGKIKEETGYQKITICQMMSGDRTMQLEVKAVADRLADERKMVLEGLQSKAS